MKIVIDIDDSIYHRFVAGFANDDDACLIQQLFKNGTLLPKGHGELIDKDIVLDMMNYGILEEYITVMGGVIPADKGESIR